MHSVLRNFPLKPTEFPRTYVIYSRSAMLWYDWIRVGYRKLFATAYGKTSVLFCNRDRKTYYPRTNEQRTLLLNYGSICLLYEPDLIFMVLTVHSLWKQSDVLYARLFGSVKINTNKKQGAKLRYRYALNVVLTEETRRILLCH